LHSQDRALIERCFSASSEDVISNTVRRLSAPDAVLLLRAAIQRLQSRPLRGEQLQIWIRAVLVCHTAYLISAPGPLLLLSTVVM
jgi:U3 small nucleolar RNA-associated protein 5